MADDPYKYYRIEARELLQGLTQGVLELEKGAVGKDRIALLLRLAHTLKGASRVVKQAGIADLAHAFEDVLGPLRENPSSVPRSSIDEMLKLADAIAVKVSGLDPIKEALREGRMSPRAEETFETVRVELGEMDALLEGISETGVQMAALRPGIEEVGRVREQARRLLDHLTKRRLMERNGSGPSSMDLRAPSLAEEIVGSLDRLERTLAARLEHARRELAEVREAADRVRLLPASAMFSSLERAVRDAAQSVRKNVEFQTSGGNNRLDAHVLGALQAALLHAVRNSVAHGIEPEVDRISSGKPPIGRVELLVERRGNQVMFVVRDDGRGIDLEAVRRVAARRGLVHEAEARTISLDRAIDLLLKGGVTTTGSITDVSGRGVGLDVVRETASRFKGTVTLKTAQGSGTSLEVTVPVSLSAMPALAMDAGGTTVAIPLDAVRGTLRLTEGEIGRSSDSDSILFDGKVVPFLPLDQALNQALRSPRRQRPWSVVVIDSKEGLAALGVDRLLGATSALLRPLPAWVGAKPLIAGGAIDPEGNPQYVLDPAQTVLAARERKLFTTEAPAPRTRILVVDDSLTTRMLEESILHSVGYEVDLAVSGEEALKKAREKSYGLYIVDVEMPGMNGFEFISQTQLDPVLRSTPSILVTSRNSPEDLKRGDEVGARAYIVKSEFDQGYLMETIRKLVG